MQANHPMQLPGLEVMYAPSIKVATLNSKIHTHAPVSKKALISVLDHNGNRFAYCDALSESEHPKCGTELGIAS
jgi:hypothetical protein